MSPLDGLGGKIARPLCAAGIAASLVFGCLPGMSLAAPTVDPTDPASYTAAAANPILLSYDPETRVMTGTATPITTLYLFGFGWDLVAYTEVEADGTYAIWIPPGYDLDELSMQTNDPWGTQIGRVVTGPDLLEQYKQSLVTHAREASAAWSAGFSRLVANSVYGSGVGRSYYVEPNSLPVVPYALGAGTSLLAVGIVGGAVSLARRNSRKERAQDMVLAKSWVAKDSETASPYLNDELVQKAKTRKEQAEAANRADAETPANPAEPAAAVSDEDRDASKAGKGAKTAAKKTAAKSAVSKNPDGDDPEPPPPRGPKPVPDSYLSDDIAFALAELDSPVARNAVTQGQPSAQGAMAGPSDERSVRSAKNAAVPSAAEGRLEGEGHQSQMPSDNTGTTSRALSIDVSREHDGRDIGASQAGTTMGRGVPVQQGVQQIPANVQRAPMSSMPASSKAPAATGGFVVGTAANPVVTPAANPMVRSAWNTAASPAVNPMTNPAARPAYGTAANPAVRPAANASATPAPAQQKAPANERAKGTSLGNAIKETRLSRSRQRKLYEAQREQEGVPQITRGVADPLDAGMQDLYGTGMFGTMADIANQPTEYYPMVQAPVSGIQGVAANQSSLYGMGAVSYANQPARSQSVSQQSYGQYQYGAGNQAVQNNYGQNNYGQGVYGKYAYSQDAYGQGVYNQNDYGQGAYTRNGYAQDAYGQSYGYQQSVGSTSYYGTGIGSYSQSYSDANKAPETYEHLAATLAARSAYAAFADEEQNQELYSTQYTQAPSRPARSYADRGGQLYHYSSYRTGDYTESVESPEDKKAGLDEASIDISAAYISSIVQDEFEHRHETIAQRAVARGEIHLVPGEGYIKSTALGQSQNGKALKQA